jgi:FKBP-type peptidyl-prolyl cis-trans isomerase
MKSAFLFLRGVMPAFVFALVFASCGNSAKQSTKYPGYFETEEGVHYKIHSVGDGEKKPLETDWLELQMINVLNDSVIYDSELSENNGVIRMPCSGSKYFSVLSEGDSATFILPATGLLQYNYDSAAQLMRMNVKLMRILSETQAAEPEKVDSELDEQRRIAVYLRNKKSSAKPNSEGLYVLETENASPAVPDTSGSIAVIYTGRFLDGRVFDDPETPLQFNRGAEGQVLRGLEMQLSKMNPGDRAVILLPSRLAFGKEGSSDGRVKPFTPVIYELKRIATKNNL